MYGFSRDTNVVIERDRDSNPVAYFEALQTMIFSGYIGPKEYKTLENIKPILTHAIEYGWFTFIAKPMFQILQFIHSYIGNWGWTIVLVTVLIKLVLYPLSYKGMVSMQKLKDLAPKIKDIQAKYKGDSQKASMHMMELYKKEGANPLGGCLPMLIQIPIFFSIYRVLVNAIELKGASFLWISDLSSMDPYFILPILMGVTMYAHQSITPNNFTDPMQEKIFKFLPLVFTLFMFYFAAGLILYWTMNNVLSFVQQFIINKAMQAKGLLTKEKGKK